MSSPLSGKTVLVTGVTGHVGYGIAHAARDAGASLVLPVRDPGVVASLERELDAQVIVSDFEDDTSVARLVEAARDRSGGLDHVVAPLGAWWQKGASLDQPSGELRALLSTYVEAPRRLLAAAAPQLRARKGSFTFVTGAAGEASNIPGAGLLVVAVAAQQALSRTLRAELAHEPFRVNEVRIAARIERAPRPGVVPSREAGEAFVEVMRGTQRGALLGYGPDRRLVSR